MPTPRTHAVDFLLVDPAKLAQTSSRELAIVMKITAVIQGGSLDTAGLNAREGSRLTNHNLVRMSHLDGDRESLRRAATESGWSLYSYCSRCGRKFRTNRGCQTCGIAFQFRADSMESVVGDFPGIPAKVVAYAKAHGHVFVKEPPRA